MTRPAILELRNLSLHFGGATIVDAVSFAVMGGEFVSVIGPNGERKLAVEEHEQSRRIIEDAGCEIVELTAKEHAAFVAAVAPLLADARQMYGEEMFGMLPKA